VRQHVPADTDLEIIPLDWDEEEQLAVPADPPPSRRRAPLLPWIFAGVAVAALVIAGGNVFRQHHEPSDARQVPTTIPTSSDPRATLTAHLPTLQGHGLIAIASNGHLRVLDARNQAIHDVYQPSDVSHPMWSPSGRWLAYGVDDTHVWVARADGTQAHQVAEVGVVRPDTVAWSPVADTLAVVARVGGIELISPEKSYPRGLASWQGAWSVVWSPDGRRIAATSLHERRLGLRVVAVAGDGVQTLGALDEDLTPAAWWPDGAGLLAWRIPQGSASVASYCADLVSSSLSGTEKRLTTTLPHPQWLSWASDRRHVVVVEGGGREAYTRKHLAVCDVVAGTCQTIGPSPGTVAVDPAWSPDGTQIAYVQADDVSAVANLEDWLGTRQLWTMSPDGSNARRLGALDGVDAPRWLPDSKRLLVVGGENALWLVDHTFVGPVASRLYEGDVPPGYSYGFVDWSQTIAWHG